MRIAIMVAALASLIVGCDLGESTSPSISASFVLTDTSGHPSSTFRSGDDFLMTLNVQNNSNLQLTYYRGDDSPDVIFDIIRDGIVVASSVDGYAFVQIPSIGHLDAGHTLRGSWRAPTTLAQFPKVRLSAGSYLVRVSYPRFDQVGDGNILTTTFTVY